MKKINYKYLIILVLIFICSFMIREYKSECLNNIKNVISSNIFFLIITFLSFPITLLYKIKFDEIVFSDFLEAKKVKDTIAELVSAITEPSTFVCSLSILKGLYLDYFFSDTYFTKFNDTEKSFLFIAAFYFFVITFIELKKYTVELVIDTEDTEIE